VEVVTRQTFVFSATLALPDELRRRLNVKPNPKSKNKVDKTMMETLMSCVPSPGEWSCPCLAAAGGGIQSMAVFLVSTTICKAAPLADSLTRGRAVPWQGVIARPLMTRAPSGGKASACI
jgi:hypothetical protein